ncbi:DNA primase [Actinomycetaceae bacterium TAE3-ERU4]|nr:DNA primase [Actinomycetaceae bacterium TAE3-ERU4]
MANKSQVALEQLLVAFENHYEVAISDASDTELAEAEQLLRNAFFTYDDVLFTNYDVELPFDMIEDEDYEEMDEYDLDDEEYEEILDDSESDEDSDDDYYLVDDEED